MGWSEWGVMRKSYFNVHSPTFPCHHRLVSIGNLMDGHGHMRHDDGTGAWAVVGWNARPERYATFFIVYIITFPIITGFKLQVEQNGKLLRIQTLLLGREIDPGIIYRGNWAGSVWERMSSIYILLWSLLSDTFLGVSQSLGGYCDWCKCQGHYCSVKS